MHAPRLAPLFIRTRCVGGVVDVALELADDGVGDRVLVKLLQRAHERRVAQQALGLACAAGRRSKGSTGWSQASKWLHDAINGSLAEAWPPRTVSQSAFSCLRMQTASSVIWTSAGGLANDLISTMSFCGWVGSQTKGRVVDSLGAYTCVRL